MTKEDDLLLELKHFWQCYQESLTFFNIIYLELFLGNLLSLSCGLCFGWTSVLSVGFSKLVADGIFVYSDLRLIHGALFIPAAVVPLFIIFPVARFGRKVVLIGSAIVLLIAFLLCSFAKIAIMFYIARVLHGIGVGTAFTVLPMYLSEISSNDLRGLCIGSMVFFIQIGTVLPSVVISSLSLQIISLICLIPLVAFLGVFSWWNPESPVFLAFFGKHQQLEKSLRVLQKPVNEEIQDINEYLEVVRNQRGISNLFKKGFFLVVMLFICQTLIGEPFLSAYISLALHRLQIPRNYIFMLIKVFILIFAPLFALLTIDKIGRKMLLLVSAIGSTVLLIIISICFYLHYSYQFYLSFWTIFVFHSLYLFFHCGLLVVPWIILGEYIAYPQKAVAFSLTISCRFASSYLFGVLLNYFLFQMRADLITGIFAIANLGTVLLVFLFIPETKKKSFQEIQRLLNRDVA